VVVSWSTAVYSAYSNLHVGWREESYSGGGVESHRMALLLGCCVDPSWDTDQAVLLWTRATGIYAQPPPGLHTRGWYGPPDPAFERYTSVRPVEAGSSGVSAGLPCPSSRLRLASGADLRCSYQCSFILVSEAVDRQAERFRKWFWKLLQDVIEYKYVYWCHSHRAPSIVLTPTIVSSFT
jgi:hypothetical protein